MTCTVRGTFTPTAAATSTTSSRSASSTTTVAPGSSVLRSSANESTGVAPWPRATCGEVCVTGAARTSTGAGEAVKAIMSSGCTTPGSG